MTESIHIKNFGPLKDIRLDDIRPFTVLIGESGSGKSVLMKILILCRWIFKRYNLHEYLRRREEDGYWLPETLEEVLPNTGLHPFVEPASEITYTVSSETLGKKHTLRFHWRTGQVLRVEGSVPPEALIYLKLSYIAETRGFIPFALYKPQMLRGADFGFFFHEVLNEFGDSNETVKRLELPYLDVNYHVEKRGLVTEHHVTGRTSDYDIEWKHASSGIQNIVPLLSIVKMYADHFDPAIAFRKALPKNISELGTVASQFDHRVDLHIEEPELGLSPAAQCDLMNTLVEQCVAKRTNNLSAVLATHSPFVLTQINNMIQAGFIRKQNADTALPIPPLEPDAVAVYQIKGGECSSLLDTETGLIRENDIDVCTSNIFSQFDTLLNMETHEQV